MSTTSRTYGTFKRNDLPSVFIPGVTKELQKGNAYESAGSQETQTVWTGTIKRLLYRYLEYRNKRRRLRRGWAEKRIVAPYEGIRWCDATERQLIADIRNGHHSHF